MRDRLRKEVGEIVTDSIGYNCKTWGDYLRREIGGNIEEKEKRFMDALGKLSMDIDILRRDVEALARKLSFEPASFTAGWIEGAEE